MENVFPQKEDVDYSRLKLSEEGEYSITKRKDAEGIISFIKTLVPNTEDKTLTDATACNGGDTINFAMNFKQVFSIEMKKENYEALNNNISIFKLDNVKTFLGDSTKLYHWYTNVLYVDPPWGGPTYHQHSNLDLFVGAIRLDTWIESVLQRENRPGYIFLKLPYNYNFKRLNFLSNVERIIMHRVRSSVVVVGIVVNLV